ncbi:LANO_0G05050g1_1 [Lachancea nothofagi CBS 11611]|uniref:LANO_0G05050g1_1 n=1 Tax=Lachancea nothofagi CBS 11611 TaxID=1266666 RepID=A0A1G4KGC0_9SACH|nr:LANO_0G05050g1_1 [Lachancea nothofagi CBS 11611]
MKRGVVIGGIVSFTFLCGYFFFLAHAIISTFLRHRFSEQTYFEASHRLLHKFDSVRRSNISVGLPKLSTNTYVDDNERDVARDSLFLDSRENATLLMLVRNWELPGALSSMRSLEDRFNKRYRYDWTFLNDVPFDDEFIEATSAMASGKTAYGLIPSTDWDRPSTINETEFEAGLQLMREKGVLYGGSKSYRNMCRFNSGFFYKQQLLDQYQYYFRVEPDVQYYCDFPYDPFKVMREKHKKYGFVIAMYEYEDTVTTLWDAVEEFMADYPEMVDTKTNSYDFITDDGMIGKDMPVIQSNSMYNLCHFWSNFEIGDLSFFRSEPYQKYFELLESKGGFYYERWGDAPVHSIAVALLLQQDEVIHFDELGYYHVPFGTCPTAYNLRLQQRCVCNPNLDQNIDIKPHSCLTRWWKHGSGKYFMKHA